MITVNTKDLKDAIAAAKFVMERTSIPILGNARLVTGGGKLSVIATDMDIESAIRIVVTGDSAGMMDSTVSIDALQKFLGAAKDSEIQISPEADKVLFKSGKASFTASTLPAEDFPEMVFTDSALIGEWDALTLKNALQMVRPAVSNEVTRYYLNGVYVERHENGLRLVATNGHQLHLVEPYDCPVQEWETYEGVLVPRKTVDALLKRLPKDDSKVRVHQNKERTRFRFDFGNETWTTKLIDGTFPDYTRVIPAEYGFSYEASAADLIEAGTFFKKLSGTHNRGVKISPADGKMNLSMFIDGDRSSYEIDASAEGDVKEVGFNCAYLVECLQSLDTDRVTIAGSDSAGPFKLTPDSTELFAEHFCILMPTRV